MQTAGGNSEELSWYEFMIDVDQVLACGSQAQFLCFAFLWFTGLVGAIPPGFHPTIRTHLVSSEANRPHHIFW